ncbi:MAG: PIN domain-containing protein [Tunicatimonas sp.]
MKVVVDANLIFSALISKASRIREAFFLETHTFYCPVFVFTELFKHKESIFKSSNLSDSEILNFLHRITERIRFVNEGLVTLESKQQAYNLCYDVDEKDTPYVALAIELRAALWTGDNKLRLGLEEKGFTHFYRHDT